MTDMHRSEPAVQAVVETAVKPWLPDRDDPEPHGDGPRSRREPTRCSAAGGGPADVVARNRDRSPQRSPRGRPAAHVTRTVATTIEREILLVDPSDVHRPRHTPPR